MSPALDRVRVLFLESLELGGKSPLTLSAYGRHLTEFEEWLDKPLAVDEIESSHVKGFLLHLKRRPKRPGYRHRKEPEGGLAPETIRHYYWTLVGFFNWCEGDRLRHATQIAPHEYDVAHFCGHVGAGAYGHADTCHGSAWRERPRSLCYLA